MKKILVAFLACAMIMSLAACGNKDKESSSSEMSSSSEISSSSEESSSEESSEGTVVDEITDEAAAEEEAKMKEHFEAETKKVEDAIKAGLENGKPETSVEGVDDKLQAVYESVKAALGESYIPADTIEKEMLTEVYGLDEATIESVIAEFSMISVNVDTFIAVKAVEGKGEDVEKALTAYRDVLVNDTMQYPMNLPKIAASKVIRNGDYVFFTVLGAPFDFNAE